MARSRWTLMVIPHDNEQTRSFQISSSLVRVALSVGLLVGVVGAGLSVAFVTKQSEDWQARRLRRENVRLSAEVDQARGQMSYLSRALEVLAKKNESYRRIAGLPANRDGRSMEPGLATLEAYASGYISSETVREQNEDLASLVRRAGSLGSSMDEAIRELRENTERLEATPSIAPADGALSSLFSPNRRHPVLRISRPHRGIDIAAPVGEPILAPAKGVVRFAGTKAGGYGRMVEIDHGYGYVTRFAHASKLLVRAGQQVERGDLIAKVGATGLTSGPHLHYEVEVNGAEVDPLDFIVADVIPD